MDYLKLIIVGLVTGIIVLAGSALLPKTGMLGATDLTTVTNRTTFSDDVTFNDPVVLADTVSTTAVVTINDGIVYSNTFATSSEGTGTYTAANITGKSTILHNATAALTATLPATSTLTTFVPNTGDRVSIVLVNIGAGVLTIAGGTGMNVYNASSTLAMPATSAATLEFVRQADTDITVLFSPAN